MIAERLELADWRRQVSELYVAIRAEPDPVVAWTHWRDVRDRPLPLAPAEPRPAERPRRRDRAALLRVRPCAAHRRGGRSRPTAQRSSSPDPRAVTSPPNVPVRRASHPRRSVGRPVDVLAARLFRWLLPLVSRCHQRQRRRTARVGICWTPRRERISGSDADGRLILDFNFAYQPSCSYDPQWSCPLPPRENWLAIPIRGGERFRSLIRRARGSPPR